MTTPSSPPPTPPPSSGVLTPEAAQELHKLFRQLRVLVWVLMLLGLIIFLIGFLSAGLPAAFHSASADQFPYLSPLARVGRGLLALGALLLLPVLFILRRRTVRIRSQGRIYVQQRYRHPRLAAIAGLWAYVVGVAIFAVLALAPRELLVGWLAQAGSVLDGFDASGLIFMGALWAGVLFASAPTLALRLFDRPR